MTYEEKEKIVADALETDEGKQAMVDAIVRGMRSYYGNKEETKEEKPTEHSGRVENSKPEAS